MKKAKLTLSLAITALLTGATVLAFKPAGETASARSKRVVQAWQYNASTSGPLEEENYSSFNGDPSQICNGSNEVCVVMAEDRGDGHPEITSSLAQQINKTAPATEVSFRD